MNYSRFYALLNRLPVRTDDMKGQLVLQYTGGRTSSLREMSSQEYNAMCAALDRSLKDAWSIGREEIRKHRSGVLHIMQRLGIDTTDWVRINAFCRDPRIAGKEFAALDAEELAELTTKLRAIQRNGGLRPNAPAPVPERPKQHIIYVPIDGIPN